MNNVQKLQQTVDKTQEVRRKSARGVKQRIDKAETYTQRHSLEKKLLVLDELEFLRGKPYFIFCSTNYGSYRPHICNRRRRIQPIPICFCVTLYEQELQAAFPGADIQIPYTLKGFWKMKKALELLEYFTKFQNKTQEVLLWEYRSLKKSGKAKAEEYVKILNEFVSMRTINSGWKRIISYNDLQFKLNTENVKLDVVPLCKLLTCYYANVVRQIDHYEERYAANWEKEKLEKIKGDFAEFMEKYFVYNV